MAKTLFAALSALALSAACTHNNYYVVPPPGGSLKGDGRLPVSNQSATFGDSECWWKRSPGKEPERVCFSVDSDEYIGDRPRSPRS